MVRRCAGTVRRFLELFGDSFDLIVLCISKSEVRAGGRER
jgi:hypothetical protein